MSATHAARSASAVEYADSTVVDPTDALSDALPMEQTQGAVHFLSGGIRIWEAIAIKRAMSRYPLTLEFRSKGSAKGEFLAGVPVTIRVPEGQVVLQTLSAGPFLLAKLRPGAYEVAAEWRGETRRRQVQVRANGCERLVFEWNVA